MAALVRSNTDKLHAGSENPPIVLPSGKGIDQGCSRIVVQAGDAERMKRDAGIISRQLDVAVDIVRDLDYHCAGVVDAMSCECCHGPL